jgi:dipicolinate synthase subunit A
MLTGVQVAVVGGDARVLEVIRIFSELDASIRLMGFDHLEHTYSGVWKAEFEPGSFIDVDAVILPPIGTNSEGQVATDFSTHELVLTSDHIRALPKHAKIYTGMINTYLQNLCSQEDIAVIALFARDDVAIYNSIPTAEGAIMMAIQETDFTIHGSTCIVLGLGRTGITLARVLFALGAKVRAGVHKPEQFARAYEMGISPFHTRELAAHAGDADLIFNTIPHMIITAQVIARIPLQAVIIDLASKPGGTDFRFADRRGIKALIAPGLPGIVAPKTAGQIIARTLSSLIFEDAGKRGNG